MREEVERQREGQGGLSTARCALTGWWVEGIIATLPPLKGLCFRDQLGSRAAGHAAAGRLYGHRARRCCFVRAFAVRPRMSWGVLRCSPARARRSLKEWAESGRKGRGEGEGKEAGEGKEERDRGKEEK